MSRITWAITGARIETGDPRRPWADALAVAGTTLAVVGSAAEVRKLAAGAPAWHAPHATVRPLAGGAPLARGADATFLVTDAHGAVLLEMRSGAAIVAAPDVPLPLGNA